MSDHRHLHDTTASHAPPDNFRPADAIESLRAAILRVDTIAQVACDAADELPYPSNAAAGRALVRMQILVEQAADEASAALAQGDRFMAALTKHLQAPETTRSPAIMTAHALVQGVRAARRDLRP